MPNAEWQSYNAIIRHVLEQAEMLAKQSSKHDIAGFQLLHGPTGGGKSSSLFHSGRDDGIPSALELIKNQGRQAIFVTHRWNILQDVYRNVVNAKDTNGECLTASIIYAQSENVLASVLGKPLRHETGFQQSDLPDAIKEIESLSNAKLLDSELGEKLVSECNHLRSHHMLLEHYNKYPHLPVVVKQRVETEKRIQNICGTIERLLLKGMDGLTAELKKAKNAFGLKSEVFAGRQQLLTKYRNNPFIRRVFPAIAWYDEKQHLLILTTQKMYSSFYDGHKKVRMAHADLRGHVVFIDEFDYQADVLLKQLAQSQLVQEPPQCLGQLLDEGRRLSRRLESHPDEIVQNANKELIGFLDDMEQDLLKVGINLSESRALVVPHEDSGVVTDFRQQYLFRSDHLVTSSRLGMKTVGYGYEIKEITDETTDDYQLTLDNFLRLMEKYLRQFTLLLTRFSSADETKAFAQDLSRLIFDSVNDYQPSYYSSTLPAMSLFSLPQVDLDELDVLVKSNSLPNTHANIYGFTNWLLRTNTSPGRVDHLRLNIQRAFLPTTPEGLLVTLASRNLVFGLSATAFIERAVGHFDMYWVNSALQYIATVRTGENPDISGCKDAWLERPIPYLESPQHFEQQQKMIARLKRIKAQKRGTGLNVYVHSFDKLRDSNEWRELSSSLPQSFFLRDGKDASQGTKAYRQSVLANLLQVIRIASSSPQHRGQIAFVNSTYYLREWLKNGLANASWDRLSWLSHDLPFQKSLELLSVFKGFSDDFVALTCDEQPLLLCLLTAETQRKAGFEEAYQAAFNTGRVVLIITQTASATNGINLNFIHPETERSMDISCLYLLETTHFYFSEFDQTNSDSDPMAHAGYQIRNLDKLRRAGEISRADQRHYLLALAANQRNGIKHLNSLYKKSIDFVNNTAADVQQQVGRLERVWDHVPEIEIYVTPDVAKTLCGFAASPSSFENHRNQISTLNEALLDHLLEWAETSHPDFFTQLMTPVQDGTKAVDIIDGIVIPAIKSTRTVGTDSEYIKRIATTWEQLGKAILQFDFSWHQKTGDLELDQPLYQWACIEVPEGYVPGQPLWYNTETWQFFTKKEENCIRYHPSQLYEPLQKYNAIVDWFNKKGFRTSIEPASNTLETHFLYHPKVTQRLLQGRLGEEAIRALLAARGVRTHTQLNHPQMLERYDFSVNDSRFRIDAKHWGYSSLNEADLVYKKWLDNDCALGSSPLNLKEKLQAIRDAEGNNICLIVINLLAHRPDCELLGFDVELTPVSVDDADILVLAGCIYDDPATPYTEGFNKLVNVLIADNRGERK